MASSAPAPCSEKERLVHDYEVAAADFSRAKQVIAERVGVMSRAQYIRIRAFCKAAGAKTDAARNAMNRHVAKHGC